jgi:hypothetical protein
MNAVREHKTQDEGTKDGMKSASVSDERDTEHAGKYVLR